MGVTRKLPRGVTKQIYMDGALLNLLKGFHNAVHKHNTSVVMVADGRSGMGKTTLANQVGITLDPNYNLENLYYTPKEFLDGLSKAKKGSCLVFDEAMLISSRSALTEVNRMVVQAMSMIRSKNLFVIFCVNSIFDIDRNIAISRADLLLNVYGSSLIDRGRFMAFFRARDGMDRLKKLYLLGKKYYDYSRPRANFLGSFLAEFVIDSDEYEIKKQKSINEFLMGSATRPTNAMLMRDKLIKWIVREKGYKAPEIADICGLSEQQIYKILLKDTENP